MEGLGMLIIFVALIISIAVAVEFRNIAQEKGYDDAKYLWYSLLCGPVGWLMVIALPDRGREPIVVEKSVAPAKAADDDELPTI